jgi:gluconokinase
MPSESLPWILALDVGSSSVRAGLFDAAGLPAPGQPARAEYAWTVDPPGSMWTDGAALLARCAASIDTALGQARRSGRPVAAVGMTTFWHGVMGVGADGVPATPLYGWGDGRATVAAIELGARLDPRTYHRRTGCWPHAAYPAAKLLWLRGVARDSLPRVATWLSIGELMVLRFFGRAVTTTSLASGTGLLDLRAAAWDGEALAAAGVDAAALPAIDDGELRGLLPEWAARWPELASVPWFPAVGDGGCASLGSGAFGPGRIGVTVGTSAAVRVLRVDAAPEGSPGLWCYRMDAKRIAAGRALSNGGNGFAWLARTLALPPAAELDAALDAMAPDSHGLTVLPALVPERPPGSDPVPGAVLHGATLATTPAAIARAWLEAIAYRIGDAAEAVEAAYGPAAEVVASGGALHASPAWARIIADVVGRPLRLTVVEEETARGAALLASERLGWITDLAATAPPGETIVPDAERHAIYRAARERQRALAPAAAIDA